MFLSAVDVNWLLRSEGGLVARIAVGALILSGLALWDLYRNRSRATRWREYAFLLSCVAIAIVYGGLNDQVTTTISWEYFAYGKGVAEVLPANEPPNSWAFRWEAAKVGMKATWTAGLIVGVAILIANNPSKRYPSLPYRRLYPFAFLVFGVTAVMSFCLAMAGYLGAFQSFNPEFGEMVAADQWRPYRFMAVFGEHLGGYVGGVIGTVIAVILIIRQRKRSRPLTTEPQTSL